MLGECWFTWERLSGQTSGSHWRVVEDSHQEKKKTNRATNRHKSHMKCSDRGQRKHDQVVYAIAVRMGV
jgi:hypothetical protein